MGATILTPHIRDPGLRAAAEIVDKVAGKAGDREVGFDDVKKAERLLIEHKKAIAAGKPEKSPLHEVHGAAIAHLENHIAELKAMFDTLAPPKKQRPFCSSFLTESIALTEPRKCAEAIAKATTGDGAELSLADFLDAKDIMNGRPTDNGEEETARVKALLDPLIADGTINPKAMEALDVFFLTGQGGLMSHGPVRITDDFKFDDVYRLPNKGAKKDKELAKVIDDYERMFKRSGYDRVYIKNKQGELFVALREKGSIDWIQPGFKVVMRNDEHKVPSGEVIHVFDERNSLKEATWGIWKKTIEKLTDAWSSAVDDRLDKTIDDAAKELVENIPATKPQKSDGKNLLTAAVLLTAVGGLSAALPAVGLTLLGASILATGTSMVRYGMLERDKTPILYAMGVTVNERQPQWY
jgi:hypothetical protein